MSNHYDEFRDQLQHEKAYRNVRAEERRAARSIQWTFRKFLFAIGLPAGCTVAMVNTPADREGTAFDPAASYSGTRSAPPSGTLAKPDNINELYRSGSVRIVLHDRLRPGHWIEVSQRNTANLEVFLNRMEEADPIGIQYIGPDGRSSCSREVTARQAAGLVESVTRYAAMHGRSSDTPSEARYKEFCRTRKRASVAPGPMELAASEKPGNLVAKAASFERLAEPLIERL